MWRWQAQKQTDERRIARCLVLAFEMNIQESRTRQHNSQPDSTLMSSRKPIQRGVKKIYGAINDVTRKHACGSLPCLLSQEMYRMTMWDLFRVSFVCRKEKAADVFCKQRSTILERYFCKMALASDVICYVFCFIQHLVFTTFHFSKK